MTDLQSQEKQELFQAVDNDVAATCSGGAAVLYDFFNRGGRRVTLTGAVANLGRVNFNNVASSIRVTGRQIWRFWTGVNFTGSAINVGPGTATRNLGGIFNNNISSARRIS